MVGLSIVKLYCIYQFVWILMVYLPVSCSKVSYEVIDLFYGFPGGWEFSFLLNLQLKAPTSKVMRRACFKNSLSAALKNLRTYISLYSEPAMV